MNNKEQKKYLEWCRKNGKSLTKLSIYEFEGHLGDKKDKVKLSPKNTKK